MTDKNTAAKAAPKAAPQAKAKPKPVKKLVVGTNSLQLPWPKDPHGYLKTVKAAVAAAKRVKGDKERMKDFLKALAILEAFAKEVYVKDVEARKEARTNAVSAKARINEKLRRQAEAKAKEYEVAAARVRSEAGIEAETGKEG